MQEIICPHCHTAFKVDQRPAIPDVETTATKDC